MAEVKWIKITTNMFDDEKIRIIESMPDADIILIIWVKLLTLAGKNNANGFILLAEDIPYTDEMLSTIFNRPLNTVRLALQVFKQFGMICFDESGYLQITNWSKHQNTEGLEKIRQQTRERVAKHRENKKLLQPPSGNVTVTLRNATDIELDKNKKEIKNDHNNDTRMREVVKVRSEIPVNEDGHVGDVFVQGAGGKNVFQQYRESIAEDLKPKSKRVDT